MRSYSNDVRMLRSRIDGTERRGPSYPMPAMRHGDGDAGSGAGSGVAARPILGLSSVWSSFLVDVPAADATRLGHAFERSVVTPFPSCREAVVRRARTCPSVVVARSRADCASWRGFAMPGAADDDYDDDEDENEDEDEENGEEDEDNDEDEEETWQV
jgi:hypothetical protein